VDAVNMADAFSVTGLIEMEFRALMYDLISPGTSLFSRRDEPIEDCSYEKEVEH